MLTPRHSRKTFYCQRYNREPEGGRTFIAKAVKESSPPSLQRALLLLLSSGTPLYSSHIWV